jgi:hypothetical protein
MDAMVNDLQDRLTSFATDNDPQPRVKCPRGERTMLLEVTQADGTWRKAKPSDTHWYYMYVRHPIIQCSRFHRLFRRRFCLPYDQYLAFLADTREEQWFPRWGRWNATTPLELLVLGAFRYLGHGFTFDDLEEATAISCETHCNFFHQFLDVGSTILYPRYVVAPKTAEDAATHMHEFLKAGFNGCVGSTDATHIVIEK